MKPTRAVQNGDGEAVYDVLFGMHVKIIVGVSIVLTAAAATASIAAFVQQAVMESRLRTIEAAFEKHVDNVDEITKQYVRVELYDRHDHHGAVPAERGPVYRGKPHDPGDLSRFGIGEKR